MLLAAIASARRRPARVGGSDAGSRHRSASLFARPKRRTRLLRMPNRCLCWPMMSMWPIRIPCSTSIIYRSRAIWPLQECRRFLPMSEQNEIELRREVHALRVEVRDLNAQVRGLVEAWQTAQGVVKFMKLIGSLATAAAAIWALAALAMERKG